MFKCETKICKRCGKRLPIDCFYSYMSFVKGNWYLKEKTNCKKCISEINHERKEKSNATKRLWYQKNRDEIIARRRERYKELFGSQVEKVVIDEFIPQEKPDKPEEYKYLWVIRNLKNYGNCYIRRLNKIDLNYIQEQVGFNLTTRRTSKDNDGYIIERMK